MPAFLLLRANEFRGKWIREQEQFRILWEFCLLEVTTEHKRVEFGSDVVDLKKKKERPILETNIIFSEITVFSFKAWEQ